MLTRTEFVQAIRSSTNFEKHTKWMTPDEVTRALDISYEICCTGADASFLIVFNKALGTILSGGKGLEDVSRRVFKTFPNSQTATMCDDITDAMNTFVSLHESHHRILKCAMEFELAYTRFNLQSK